MSGINPGDGWRLLKLGEIVKDGDEWWCDWSNEWKRSLWEGREYDSTSRPMRRRLEWRNGDTLARQLDETRAMLAASRQERDRLQVTLNRLAVHILNLDVAIGRVIVPEDVRSACKAALEAGR